MDHTFETAGNLLNKLVALGRSAMTREHEAFFNEAYFKSLLESLMIEKPEVAAYIEERYHFAKKLHSREKI